MSAMTVCNHQKPETEPLSRDHRRIWSVKLLHMQTIITLTEQKQRYLWGNVSKAIALDESCFRDFENIHSF